MRMHRPQIVREQWANDVNCVSHTSDRHIIANSHTTRKYQPPFPDLPCASNGQPLRPFPYQVGRGTGSIYEHEVERGLVRQRTAPNELLESAFCRFFVDLMINIDVGVEYEGRTEDEEMRQKMIKESAAR